MSKLPKLPKMPKIQLDFKKVGGVLARNSTWAFSAEEHLKISNLDTGPKSTLFKLKLEPKFFHWIVS